MQEVCKHEGCSNIVPEPRLSKRGHYIRYKQCAACSCSISNYGITTPERKQILENQNNKCCICKKDISFQGQTKKGDSSQNAAVLNHCHKTFAVRGVLCVSCNRALGLFQDSKEVLKSAIEYLERVNNV
jgi:hypothetical protein